MRQPTNMEQRRTRAVVATLCAMFGLSMLSIIFPPEEVRTLHPARRSTIATSGQNGVPGVPETPAIGPAICLAELPNQMPTGMAILPPTAGSNQPRVLMSLYSGAGTRVLEYAVNRESLYATCMSDRLLGPVATRAPIFTTFSCTGRIAATLAGSSTPLGAVAVAFPVEDGRAFRFVPLPSNVGVVPNTDTPQLHWDASGNRLLVIGSNGFDVYTVPPGTPSDADIPPPLQHRFVQPRPELVGGQLFEAGNHNLCVLISTGRALELRVCRPGGADFRLHDRVTVCNNPTYDKAVLVGTDDTGLQRLVRCQQSGGGSGGVSGSMDPASGLMRFHVYPTYGLEDAWALAVDASGDAFVTADNQLVKLFYWPARASEPTEVGRDLLTPRPWLMAVDCRSDLILALTCRPSRLVAIPIHDLYSAGR